MYCFHFEPIVDYRHKNERPIAWVVRAYEGDDALAKFKANEPYTAQITLVRKCLNIAEAKGLTQTINKRMFQEFLKQLYRIDVDVLEIKRHGKMHIYEVSQWV